MNLKLAHESNQIYLEKQYSSSHDFDLLLSDLIPSMRSKEAFPILASVDPQLPVDALFPPSMTEMNL